MRNETAQKNELSALKNELVTVQSQYVKGGKNKNKDKDKDKDDKKKNDERGGVPPRIGSVNL